MVVISELAPHLWSSSQPSLLGESQASEEPCLKSKKRFTGLEMAQHLKAVEEDLGLGSSTTW